MLMANARAGARAHMRNHEQTVWRNTVWRALSLRTVPTDEASDTQISSAALGLCHVLARPLPQHAQMHSACTVAHTCAIMLSHGGMACAIKGLQFCCLLSSSSPFNTVADPRCSASPNPRLHPTSWLGHPRPSVWGPGRARTTPHARWDARDLRAWPTRPWASTARSPTAATSSCLSSWPRGPRVSRRSSSHPM